MNVSSDGLELAIQLMREGNRTGALREARRAVALEPQEPAIHNIIGVLADGEFDLEGAARAFGRALARDPYNILVFGNLAAALARNGMVEGALRVAHRTLALEPAHTSTHNNIAQALKGAGFLVEAAISYRRTMALGGSSGLHSNLLFTMSYDDHTTSEALFNEYRRWDRMHARRHYVSDRGHSNTLDPDRKLVVGYLSQDFHEHPLGRILAALFENHDPRAIQVNAYVELRRFDGFSDRCQRHTAVWRPVIGQSDADVARQMVEDKVDILVVVGGHSAHNRLLVATHRPAPIQMSLYDVSTSGLDTVDYWVTDPLLHPEGGRDWSERFTEKLLRLPCFFLQPPDENAPPPAPPPVLRERRISFGSFSNPAKLTPPTVSAWAAALRAVPGSRLGLKYVDWYADAVVQARVLGLFATQGIGADRIVFGSGDHNRNEQFALWNDIDIALDPYPFGGWTSTFEALWMGVPVITLLGERFAGRVGYSVLSRLGLGDLVARTPEEFGKIAAALAGDLQRLQTIRNSLRDTLRVSPLCSGAVQARYFEAGYRDAWRLWCREQVSVQTPR
jgi:predicted O-linked N-acetylglucosamine transferase (SPINDLY family)